MNCPNKECLGIIPQNMVMTNTKTNKTYKGELISDLDTRYHSEKKISFYGVGFGNHFK